MKALEREKVIINKVDPYKAESLVKNFFFFQMNC